MTSKQQLKHDDDSFTPPQKLLYLPKTNFWLRPWGPDTSAADATASCMD